MSLPEENGPLFLLSLDGGGIRGVSELIILDCIMRKVQIKAHLDELPRPCDYFDLIAGTSTGGLIAILLGRLQMTTEEALETYDEVAETLFSKKNRKISANSQFKASTLADIVKKIVGQRTKGDLLRAEDTPPPKCKAFVCAIDEMELGAIHRLRTYETDNNKSDEWLRDCKIWEAARATTAAPLNFKAMTIERDTVKKSFVDAALGYNNPAEQLLDEACSVFHRERTLGALVSLGTGTRKMSLANAGSASAAGYLASLGKTLKNEATDTERAHQRIKGRLKRCPNTYYRFNVPYAADEVKLAAWKKMGELKDMTMDYVADEAVKRNIDDLVDLLLQKKKPEGLTLKYIGLLFDRKDFIKSSRRAQHMGSSSNFFTGRGEVLRSMDRRFRTRGTEDRSRREFLVCGMGGAGKTQIALKFVETRAKSLFKRCFWVDATDIYTAQEGYEEIANEAFPEKENGSTSMKEVQNWMSTLEEEWLLVLDNSNADDIREFVPPGKTGNIIYTSRRHNLAVSLRPEWVAEVNEIESDDAITLLLLTAGLVAYHPDRRAEAAPVVQELGYLPLAIDQAGAYIRRMGRPLGAYLALFRNQRQQLIRDPDFKCMLRDPAVKGTDPRNQAVYATFDISYNALRDIMHEHDGTRKGEDARNALNLLRLICFYHNDSVMVDMFYRAAAWRRPSSKRPVHPLGYGKDSLNNLVTVIDNEWDKDPVMFGLMVLEDFSLAKWDEGRENISMHILVYDWARARIGTADMTRRAGYARAILFDSIPYDKQLASFRFRRRIYPHMEACMRRTEIWAENDCVRAEYMMKLGTLYEQKGQYQDARNVLQEAICLLEVERGRGDHHTLRAMERLASVEHDDFKLGAAEFLFLQCVERCDIQIKEINARQEARKVERPNPNELEWSPEYVEYVKQRRQAEVMEDESLFKRSSALKAEMLKKLAGVYILQAMWTSAEEALHKSIALYDEFAPGSAASANARRSLSGIIAHRDGSSCQGPSRTPQDARASLLEAIRVYGHDDMRTMNAMEALVKAEIETGNAGAAEEVAYFFFARCAEEYGQDSKQLLNALSLFCSVLDQKKQAIATEEYRRNILAASQRTLGLYHPKTIDRLLFLGAAITQSGRFDEGEMVFAKGLEVMEAVFGSTHESVREHREVLETMKNNKARASTATLRGLAREALRQNHMYLGKTLVEDEAFEDWVDFWVRYNHITKYWNKGFPEQAYFAEPPPLVNSQFVAEEEEQQANRQLELPLQHGFS